jgi:hypothetical protein
MQQHHYAIAQGIDWVVSATKKHYKFGPMKSSLFCTVSLKEDEESILIIHMTEAIIVHPNL